MPRSRIVTVNGKTLKIEEKRIGELEALAEKVGASFGGALAANTVGDLSGTVKAVLYEKIPEIIPELTSDDIKNAYPSEIEALVEAFVDVNFTGVRQLLGQAMPLLQAGLTQKR